MFKRNGRDTNVIDDDPDLDPYALEELDPSRLVPLSALVAEGFGRNITELAGRLKGDILLDDIGRQAVTRSAARRLFAERAAKAAQVRAKAAQTRAESKARRAEAQERAQRIAEAKALLDREGIGQ